MENLMVDPRLRSSIFECNFNEQDSIQRAHRQKGHCRSINNKFLKTLINSKLRRFIHLDFLHVSHDYIIERDAI